MTLREQLDAAGLTIADMIRLSQGVLTESMLHKHASGRTPLSPEHQRMANRIIAEYRMMTEKLKFVVFEAVGKPVA
jgi:hypothetical protein